MEVIATIEFTTPCLGNERQARRDLMLRSKSGNVIFLQTWWRCSLSFAAQALGRFQKDISAIQVDPEVVGNTDVYKRYYDADKFKEHEAFLVGNTIKVRFLLPHSLNLLNFTTILETAGKYSGISPYGYKQDFGRFVVVNVAPLKKDWNGSITPGSDSPGSGQLASGDASLRGTASAVLDLHT